MYSYWLERLVATCNVSDIKHWWGNRRAIERVFFSSESAGISRWEVAVEQTHMFCQHGACFVHMNVTQHPVHRHGTTAHNSHMRRKDVYTHAHTQTTVKLKDFLCVFACKYTIYCTSMYSCMSMWGITVHSSILTGASLKTAACQTAVTAQVCKEKHTAHARTHTHTVHKRAHTCDIYEQVQPHVRITQAQFKHCCNDKHAPLQFRKMCLAGNSFLSNHTSSCVFFTVQSSEEAE